MIRIDARLMKGLAAGLTLAAAAALPVLLNVDPLTAQGRLDSKPSGIKAGGPGGETRTGRPNDFDFSRLDSLLQKYIKGGLVDYAAWKKAGAAELDAVLGAMAAHPYSRVLARESRLAFLINAYNAYTLQSILKAYPVGSVMDIPGFFDKAKHRLHDGEFTLDEIEKTLIKKSFADMPEYHLAIVCGGKGCPPLRSNAYTADSLAAQFGDQARRVFTNPAMCRYDEKANVLHLSELFQWYREDFEQGDKTLASLVAPHFSLSFALKVMKENPAIEFIPFDWDLNDAGSK